MILFVFKSYMNFSFSNTEINSFTSLIISGSIFFIIYIILLFMVRFDLAIEVKEYIFKKLANNIS